MLEPMQTGRSITAQVDELKCQLESNGSGPFVLIGWSWGTWLSCLLAAAHPSLVSRLILVGCAPFHARDATRIAPVRRSRLTDSENVELSAFFAADGTWNERAFKRAMQLSDKADAYELLGDSDAVIKFDRAIFEAVWPEAAELRKSGELLSVVEKIRCPVHAIHGDSDPHPADGVSDPLGKMLTDFEFVLLDRCGHKPWLERYARDAFYGTLERILYLDE